MTSVSDRQRVMTLIDEAVDNGARQIEACKELDISARTLQRWRIQPEDRRPQALRPVPANKLSEPSLTRYLRPSITPRMPACHRTGSFPN